MIATSCATSPTAIRKTLLPAAAPRTTSTAYSAGTSSSWDTIRLTWPPFDTTVVFSETPVKATPEMSVTRNRMASRFVLALLALSRLSRMVIREGEEVTGRGADIR
ncbi:MAG TPA: hypothetical protein VM120_02590 [Bryobacteraceae bacterium]|nr:hypothetical protein [Bryobacteraceae bacterium]